MNWLLAYLIWGSLSIGIFFVLRSKKVPLRKRLLSAFALSVPLLFYIVDYQKARWLHTQDCKAQGGLKIFFEPEKTDQIFIKRENSTGYKAAESYLKAFYPELRAVYVINDWGQDKGKYFVSKVTSITDDKYKRGWKFSHTETALPDEPLYMLNKEEIYNKSLHQSKQVWSLNKAGKTYATIINFDRFWPKIRYPDAVPGWSCRDVSNEYYFSSRERELIKLVIF